MIPSYGSPSMSAHEHSATARVIESINTGPDWVTVDYTPLKGQMTFSEITHHENKSVLRTPPYTQLLFEIVKLGLTGVYFFLIFATKHRLWVLVRTASLRRF